MVKHELKFSQMQKTATENRLRQEQSAGVTAVIWNEKAHNKSYVDARTRAQAPASPAENGR